MHTPPASLRIACWQAAAFPRDIAANLAAIEDAARRAQAAGAELLIGPEMIITGYNIGDDIAKLAQQRPLEQVRAIAQRTGVAIVAGGPESITAAAADGEDGHGVANAAWLISPDGDVLARHHKLQLFGDLDHRYFTAGDRPTTIVDYRGVRIALLICFDIEFPETARAAALAGADLIAVPTAQMKPFEFVNEHLIRVRAWENAVYLAYVNQVGTDGDFDYVGRSVIADPFGEHLAEGPAEGEALIFATVDSRTLSAARDQNPYIAQLRRELF